MLGTRMLETNEDQQAEPGKAKRAEQRDSRASAIDAERRPSLHRDEQRHENRRGHAVTNRRHVEGIEHGQGRDGDGEKTAPCQGGEQQQTGTSQQRIRFHAFSNIMPVRLVGGPRSVRASEGLSGTRGGARKR